MSKITKSEIEKIIQEEIQNVILEKDDRCTRIAKRKYDVWPSAYASGAVVRCRKGEIWKDVKEDEDVIKDRPYRTDAEARKDVLGEDDLEETDLKNIALDIAGLVPGIGEFADMANAVDYAKKGDYLFAALSLVSMVPAVGDVVGKGGKIGAWITKTFPKGAKAAVKYGPEIKKFKGAIESSKPMIDELLAKLEDNEQIGEYIPDVKEALSAFMGSEESEEGELEEKKKTDYSKEKESGLHGWFSRAGGKGKSKGWVDCNTCRKDPKTGRKKCKACGREKGEKRAKYPACRPTPSDCGTKGKGEKWGKKSAKKESLEMNITKSQIQKMILEEAESVYYEMLVRGETLEEAEYQGRKVTLNKPFRTPDGPKKSSVYVKNEKGNVVKVNFGDPNMKIKKNIPARRKSFRARHNCDNPGPKWKARYWSCKAW